MVIKEAGIRLTLQGQAAYLSGLKSVSSELKSMSTQSKLAVAQLGSNAKQQDILKTSAKNLANELKVSEEKTLALKNAKDKYTQSLLPLKRATSETTDQHQKAVKRTEELKQKYDEIAASEGKRSKAAKTAKAEYEASKTTMNQLAKEVKELTDTYDSNAKKLGQLPNEINKSELASQNLRNELERLDTTFKKLGGNKMDLAQNFIGFGEKLKELGASNIQLGSNLTNSITRPLVGGFKQAVIAAGEFQSEIGALGPLLSGGKDITADVRKEMDLLGQSSRQWAKDYGKSTSEINGGMSELVRNGYTSSQVMGMIPNMLDASIASGEGFNTVMMTSSQVLSQFNLKGKTTEETLANTQRVTDSLTYVANATASGFSDLGAGMAYVGPVANSLNMSVEETASILGVLSNKGIEASAGGTALRGALTKLLKPSKQNASAMAELGISAEEFQKGTIKLPDIIDKIRKNTQGWTDEQRAAAIATAFGTEAQTAMNALVEEGGTALRNLTKEAEGASGATKRIAESMKELPEFKYQQLMAEVKDLGIELGTALLPVVMDVMGYIKELLDWFSNLDDGAKQLILITGLMVAALGPLLTALGTLQIVVGKTSKGIGLLIKGLGNGDSLLKTTQALSGMTKEGMATNGIFGKLMTTIKPFAPFLLKLTGILGAAYIAWKLFGEEAYNASQAVKEFPDIEGITVKQAESIRGLKDDFHNLNVQMGSLGENMDISGVTQSVSTIGQEIQTLNSEKIESLKEKFSQLPSSVQESLKSSLEATIQNIEEQTGRVEEITNRLTTITEKGLENGGKIPEKYLKEISGLTQEAMGYYALALGENAEQSEQIYQTLTKSHADMTENQLLDRRNYLLKSKQMLDQKFDDEKKAIYDFAKESKASYEDLNQALTVNEKNRAAEMLAIQTDMVHTGKEMFERYGESLGVTYDEMLSSLEEHTGLTRKEIEAIWNSDPIYFGDMEQGALEASNKVLSIFNDMEINPAEINTENIDMFVSKMEEVGLTWQDLELLSKSASIDDNVKEFLNKAAEANGGWDQLILNEKQAEISLDDESLENAISSLEDYNNLTIKEKIATLSAKGSEEIKDLLIQLDLWDTLDPKQQELIMNSTGHELVEETIHAIEDWNTLSPEDKAIHIESQVASQQLKDVITESNLWNNTEFQNKFIGIDTNIPDAEVQITNLVNEFLEAQGLPPISVAAETKNFDVVQAALSGMPLFASAAASDMPLIVAKASTDGVESSKSQVQDLGATADANANKSVSVTSNLIGMVANLITMGLYNAAADKMTDKTVSATTSTPGMSDNTTLIKDYNTKSGEMKDTKAVASTYTPNMSGNTNLVMNWNRHTDSMKNKSSTMTTYTPGIHGNTSSVHRWNAAVNSAYSKTVSFTTYHDKVYRTFGKHATGGHIDAYANGGNLTWAGMFANGGGVPVGYTGIVGEAGPEIFQVTKKGVNITPLSTREKMRGIEGVLDDYNGGNKGQTVNININIDGPVLREEQDMDTLVDKIGQRLKRQITMSELFNKGRMAT